LQRLGSDQASNAAAIGIYTAIFAGTAAVALGGSPTLITAPGMITDRESLFSGNDGLSLRSLHDLPISSLCGESKNPKTVQIRSFHVIMLWGVCLIALRSVKKADTLPGD